MLPSVWMLFFMLMIVDGTIPISSIKNAAYISSNMTNIFSYNGTYNECICYAFFSNISINYEALNCYKNNKTCLLFTRYLSISMIRIYLNSTFYSKLLQSSQTTIEMIPSVTSSPLQCIIPQWDSTGITFASIGTNLNQIFQPHGLFIAAGSDILYIADTGNSRILKWFPGNTSGTLIAGGQGVGSNATQLNNPTEVYVDSHENVYVADSSNYRIQYFDRGSSIGRTLVSNGMSGSTNILSGTILGLGVDLANNVYMSNYNNYCVTKWPLNATYGILVTGTDTEGNSAYQLSTPAAFYVEPTTGILYIPNQASHCITKWTPGNLYGIVVAGTCGVSGSNETLLYSPTCVTFDKYGNMYVIDWVNNGRIMMFCPNSLIGTPIITSGLNIPISIAVDTHLNLYVSDCQTFGILDVRYHIKNECSVRIETEHGIETCFNQKCSDYKDPLRILGAYIQDRACYVHYLKLAFSTYDQFLIFIEFQSTNKHSLGEFFDTQNSRICMLDIEIDSIYPFNKKYFLSENMLQKLGGSHQTIDLLQIEIKQWYKSSRTIVQIIDNDLITKQPFRQILIYYQCHDNQTIEKLILMKHLKQQEKSTCPRQIYIKQQESIGISNRNMTNLTDLLFNKSNFYQNQKGNSPQWNLFAKIGIVIILIILIVGFVVYHLIYPRSQTTNDH